MILRSRVLTLFWLFVAVMAVLAIGALRMRQEYLTRGIPEGLPDPVRGGGPLLGINVSLEQYDDEALLATLAGIRHTGVRYLKQTFFYNESLDWAEPDRILRAAAEGDLILVPLLDGDPASGYDPGENPEKFAAWAGAFAARYASQLSHYIIWDEPNLSSHWGHQAVNATEYAALLSAAAAAIREADPGAIIVAAPLAPTVEEGPDNLADPIYLQLMYEAGAASSFDIVAGKPYGFDVGPEERSVAPDVLNFSRIVLLREVMERNGDANKAVWAGNWGWNALPNGWQGSPSIWGQTSEETQASWTIAAFDRARHEWPWMGLMFLENWEPGVAPTDPRWGFSVAGRETASALASQLNAGSRRGQLAFPGFHQAAPDAPGQMYQGNWRFSPQFGADISESGDQVSFTFWGSDVGLRVRRADFRARLYVTVDGLPANALPRDENGSTLVLTSARAGEDYLSTEWVARDLEPGEHQLVAVAARGWEQWALNGFAVGYQPDGRLYRFGTMAMVATAVLSVALAYREGRRGGWPALRTSAQRAYQRLTERQQLALTVVAAAMVAATGWLTWGQQVAGLYRRLGDGSQLALTAAAASIFYVAPSFIVYVAALALLFFLVYLRPFWGVALIAFAMPFYVLPKPMLGYRFSPVEVFTVLTLAATLLSWLSRPGPLSRLWSWRKHMLRADYAVLTFTLVATLSLLFTERLDVASNEWRVVILEPALFYVLLRGNSLSGREMWRILDSFVLGGVVVALYGLGQYVTGEGLITAEAGLMRLRSIYGSPNNVGLYLGRVFPVLAAMALVGSGENGSRRRVYALLTVPTGLALLLSFSKGALFLGLPAAMVTIVWIWSRKSGRNPWPWLGGLATLGVAGFLLAGQIPQLAGRLDVAGATGVFRVNLWRASLNMMADHPWFGVGLDNFLYEYRGRYIFDAAWQEPNLSHPHNLLLDFGTRVGVFGLAAGGWLFWQFLSLIRRAINKIDLGWTPMAVGLAGVAADMLGHGLVDHAFFLVDLAFAFYLMLAIAIWLNQDTGRR